MDKVIIVLLALWTILIASFWWEAVKTKPYELETSACAFLLVVLPWLAFLAIKQLI